MGIQKVGSEDHKLLRDISDCLQAAKKIVVVTGAGISTSCGIPDFRSEDGLYSLINAKHNARLTLKQPSKARGHIKGKDLFDANLWKSEESTSVFYTFIASLRRKIKNETRGASATHKFIRRLRDEKKLVRCYTQNIDGLEAREGLCQDLERGKGSRGRFTRKALRLPIQQGHSVPGGQLEGGCEVVQLHGDLEALRCTICRHQSSWGVLQEAKFFRGQAPACPTCAREDQERRERGKRGSTIGTLRPNVVLYGEENPASESISSIVSHDLRLGPDLLIIMGTSLKVHGLKILVKEFARTVHSKKNGKVIFVNSSPPAESTWRETIDCWIDMKCDDWARDKFRDRQTQIPFKVGKLAIMQVPQKSSSEQDKENIQTTPSNAVGSKFTKSSPSKSPKSTLPTPPASHRRALSNTILNSSGKTPPAHRDFYASTPTKKRGMEETESLAESITVCSSAGSPKHPVVLLTPRSDASTPGKRKRLNGDFVIWDSERDGDTDEAETQRLSVEIFNSPSARSKRRKLA